MDLTAYKSYYIGKLRALASTYLNDKPKLSLTDQCCISFSENEVTIISLSRKSGSHPITALDKMRYDEPASLKLILSGVIESKLLSQTPITWLLSPIEYDVNLIDAMPVPKSELQTALSWRVKSLVNYPIEDTALQYFELPAKKNSPTSPLIAVVTAQKSVLEKKISLLKASGGQLTAIDIPEIAMLNLAALHENDEKSTAFLFFYDGMVILNISYKKTLYFTRRITIGKNTNQEPDYEKVSLEILRYFDFFRSQWRLASPTRIFAASEKGDAAAIAKHMTERLLNTVSPYHLNEPDTQIESQFLLEYGCLLGTNENAPKD